MKTGTVLAIVGAILLMTFAFANLGMYLLWSRDWGAFALLMIIAGSIGALPGLVIRVITSPRRTKNEPQS